MANILIPGVGQTRIIDSSNAHEFANDSSTLELRGYSGRDYEKEPFGAMPWGNFPLDVIPESEWAERIKEGHARKTFAIYHHQRKKVPILGQKRTNYCWMNAVVGAIMNMRACNNQETINLSSASAAAPGKNYANVGGWTGEAIRYIAEYKLAPHSCWPNAAIDQGYFRKTRDRAIYDVGNWWELRPKNFAEVMTCLLKGFCVPVGLLWWGHAVFYNTPLLTGSRSYGVGAVNSWGPDWEKDGMTALAQDKATPDEANCITSSNLIA